MYSLSRGGVLCERKFFDFGRLRLISQQFVASIFGPSARALFSPIHQSVQLATLLHSLRRLKIDAQPVLRIQLGGVQIDAAATKISTYDTENITKTSTSDENSESVDIVW